MKIKEGPMNAGGREGLGPIVKLPAKAHGSALLEAGTLF